MIRYLVVCILALAGKFKLWLSVKKKLKKLGSIGGFLEEPLCQNMFIGVWPSDLPIACHLQGNLRNDRNLLRILNFWVKRFSTENGLILAQSTIAQGSNYKN